MRILFSFWRWDWWGYDSIIIIIYFKKWMVWNIQGWLCSGCTLDFWVFRLIFPGLVENSGIKKYHKFQKIWEECKFCRRIMEKLDFLEGIVQKKLIYLRTVQKTNFIKECKFRVKESKFSEKIMKKRLILWINCKKKSQI